MSKLFLNKFKIVFSSKYHLSTYPLWAPAKEKVVIPYGIEKHLFRRKIMSKCPERHGIYTSNPMRGLSWLLEKWKIKIFPSIPSQRLLIYSISNIRKIWKSIAIEIQSILSKAKSLRNKGVILNEPIERKKLFNKLENSRVFIYKGSKEETFCMALAEALSVSWNASSGN